MRYIKHSDPLSLANKLRSFSRKLEDVILLLKELNENNNDSVRRYFKDENNISIHYKYTSSKTMNVSLRHNKDNSVSMVFLLFDNWWIPKNILKNIQDFYDYVKIDLSDYIITENNDKNKKYISTKYKFDISECNKILKLLSSFEIYMNSMKYNL